MSFVLFGPQLVHTIQDRVYVRTPQCDPGSGLASLSEARAMSRVGSLACHSNASGGSQAFVGAISVNSMVFFFMHVATKAIQRGVTKTFRHHSHQTTVYKPNTTQSSSSPFEQPSYIVWRSVAATGKSLRVRRFRPSQLCRSSRQAGASIRFATPHGLNLGTYFHVLLSFRWI